MVTDFSTYLKKRMDSIESSLESEIRQLKSRIRQLESKLSKAPANLQDRQPLDSNSRYTDNFNHD